MPIVKNYERLFDMLPEEMKGDGFATNFKEILGVYSKYADDGDALNNSYGSILDVREAVGDGLDFVGAMFGLFRLDNVERVRSIFTDDEPNTKIKHSTYVDDGKIIHWNSDISATETYFSSETDEEFRYRITKTTVARKISTTIPELQQAIDATVTTGKLYVLENHDDLPCNVYLTGTADEDSIRRAVDAIADFLPAGVRMVIAVVQFSTWQNIKDQYTSWQSMADLGVIW